MEKWKENIELKQENILYMGTKTKKYQPKKKSWEWNEKTAMGTKTKKNVNKENTNSSKKEHEKLRVEWGQTKISIGNLSYEIELFMGTWTFEI